MEKRRKSVEEVIGISVNPRLESSLGFKDPPLIKVMIGRFGKKGSSMYILKCSNLKPQQMKISASI